MKVFFFSHAVATAERLSSIPRMPGIYKSTARQATPAALRTRFSPRLVFSVRVTCVARDYIEFQPLSESCGIAHSRVHPKANLSRTEKPRSLFFSIKYISLRRFRFRERTLLPLAESLRPFYYSCGVRAFQPDSFVLHPLGFCSYADRLHLGDCSRVGTPLIQIRKVKLVINKRIELNFKFLKRWDKRWTLFPDPFVM